MFGADAEPEARPFGHGLARLLVGRGGNVTVSGRLADSTPFAQSVPLSSAGHVPLHAALYSRKGSVSGWLRLLSNAVSDVESPGLLWSKTQAAGGKLYPLGFTNKLAVEGSRYSPPASGRPGVGFSNVIVQLAGGNLSGIITYNAAIDAKGKLKVSDPGSNLPSASIQLSRGELNGTFHNRSTGQNSGIKGVVLPRQNLIAGFFLGTNQSGSVRIFKRGVPPPDLLWARPRFVNWSSAHPVSPYTNWATAARSIQEAIDVAGVGDEILVTNGVYATGGRALDGKMITNRVAITKPLVVRSMNGPEVTVIEGWPVHNTAVRCAYLCDGALLSGFTLTRGGTRSDGNDVAEQCGGGLACESTNALATNCVLSGNAATKDGGGAYSGTLKHCVFMENRAGDDGGGAAGSLLEGCTLAGNSAEDDGGGAERSTLKNCALTDNTARDRGGGAYGGDLIDCTVARNSAQFGGGASVGSPGDMQIACQLVRCVIRENKASTAGGGAYGATLTACLVASNSAGGTGGGTFVGVINNCVVTGNSASQGGGAGAGTLNNCAITGNAAAYSGGGAFRGMLNNCTITGNSARGYGGGGTVDSGLNNCIVYYNLATTERGPNHLDSTLSFSCTVPLPPVGEGNLTNAPLFLDVAAGHLRLAANSPCINSGRNVYAPAGPDLDGLPRIVGGTADIGAYEFQAPQSTISYGWLQQHGLPTDGSADGTDPDGDHLNNHQEWRAGTNPVDAASVLRLREPKAAGSNVVVTWESVIGRDYFLEGSANLALPAGFHLLATNIPGQPGTTTFTHTNGVARGARCYRVGLAE